MARCILPLVCTHCTISDNGTELTIVHDEGIIVDLKPSSHVSYCYNHELQHVHKLNNVKIDASNGTESCTL